MTDSSEIKPFRFLDLPKELRLMVYEFLPVKTTHYAVEVEQIEGREEHRDIMTEEGNTWMSQSGVEHPKSSIILAHKSIAGLAIMRTSKKINSEAEAILRCRLEALRTAPIQIITNSVALKSWEMEQILSCFSHSACHAYDDVRRLLQPGHLNERHTHSLTVRDPSSRQIHIAIRNSFVDDFEPVKAYCARRRMYILRDFIYSALFGDLIGLYYGLQEYDEKPNVGHCVARHTV